MKTKAQIAKERLDLASSQVASLSPEQCASLTADRLISSFGISWTDAERLLKRTKGN